MKKRLIFTLLSVLQISIATAQNSDDAWEMSQTIYQGTAKATAMGNALGAVGGDFTATCINPAGMGLYRKWEMTTSMGFQANQCQSEYYGTDSHANKFMANIPNFAFVMTEEQSNYKNLRFSQFGIGLTRTNDFNYQTLANGDNPTSSLIDSYLLQIPEGSNPSELDAFILYPAFRTGVLTFDGQYYNSPVPQGNLSQQQKKSFKGRSEEWTFAFSRNYSNRLYLGLSLGLDHIKRLGTKTLSETPYNSETDLQVWHFSENISTTGWGVNLKLGTIYCIAPWFRIGASYHTPTAYNLDETWSTYTESNFVEYGYSKYNSPSSAYEYDFFTPGKFIGSLAFIINRQALIAIDAEYLNYAQARFMSNDYDYSTVNNDIKNRFTKTYNLRIGTEWQLNRMYIRGGASYYGSPYGFGDSSGSIKKASCGFGIQTGEFTYFDFAYEHSYSKTYFTLYDAGDLGFENIEQTTNRSLLVATIKFKF